MLADDGVIERQRFLVILDELWNTLAAGPGIVDQVNALTRLNREMGGRADHGLPHPLRPDGRPG